MKSTCLIVLLSAVMAVTSYSADKYKQPEPKSATKVKNVGVEEFDKLRLAGTNVVLDVRTPEEFKEGHIPGAVNIDINAADFDKKISALNKDKTYLVHCAAGGRSARACKKLDTMGFKQMYNLTPGFNGWEKAHKPVEK